MPVPPASRSPGCAFPPHDRTPTGSPHRKPDGPQPCAAAVWRRILRDSPESQIRSDRPWLTSVKTHVFPFETRAGPRDEDVERIGAHPEKAGDLLAGEPTTSQEKDLPFHRFQQAKHCAHTLPLLFGEQLIEWIAGRCGRYRLPLRLFLAAH